MTRAKVRGRAEEHLRQELGREPGVWEVVDHMKIDPADYPKYLAPPPLSLDTPEYENSDNPTSISARLIDPRPERSGQHLKLDEVWKMVDKCCNERDKRMLRRIYRDGALLKDLPTEMGVSHQTQVCTMRKKVINQLRFIFRHERDEAWCDEAEAA